MKKIFILILALGLIMCGCGKEKPEVPSAEELLTQLQSKNSNLSDIKAFTAETDPNGNLGRPNQYISKADFADKRIDQYEDDLNGGTIEVFESKDDCKKRTEYLKKMNDPNLGFLALNQYIYQYDKVLFRVEYDLTPEQAEEYHIQMNEIMEQYQ